MNVPNAPLPPSTKNKLLPNLRQIRNHLQLLRVDRHFLLLLRFRLPFWRLRKIHKCRPIPMRHFHIHFLHLFLIGQTIHNRPNWHGHNPIQRTLPKALPTTTTLPILCLHHRLIEKWRQIILMRLCPQNNGSASPSISSIRPSLWNKRFTAERNGTISTVPSFSKYTDMIDKHRARTLASLSPPVQPSGQLFFKDSQIKRFHLCRNRSPTK